MGASLDLQKLIVYPINRDKLFLVEVALRFLTVTEMLIMLEQARSMAMLATMMAEEPDAAERRKAIAAAKVQIGRSGRFIGQQAIQLHGGIGMTMEYKVGHYFKRVMAIDVLFGDADYHLAAIAKTGGLLAA